MIDFEGLLIKSTITFPNSEVDRLDESNFVERSFVTLPDLRASHKAFQTIVDSSVRLKLFSSSMATLPINEKGFA